MSARMKLDNLTLRGKYTLRCAELLASQTRCEKLERVAKAAKAIRDMPSYDLLCRCIECTAAKVELDAALADMGGE